MLVLLLCNTNLDFEKLLVYESAPYPTSVFNDKGAMRPCNHNKSKLMTGLKLEVSARTVGKPDAFFIDGCAIFCVVAK